MSDSLPQDRLWEWAQQPSGQSVLAELMLLIVFVVLAIRALLDPTPTTSSAAPSPVRLGTPRLVGMSASDAAEAAQLLGSSVAQAWTKESEE
jgi:hypothetical protein